MNETTARAETIRLGGELPPMPEFDPSKRRAPDRGFRLSPAQTRQALKNALRYVPESLHETLAPEFLHDIRGVSWRRLRPETTKSGVDGRGRDGMLRTLSRAAGHRKGRRRFWQVARPSNPLRQ